MIFCSFQFFAMSVALSSAADAVIAQSVVCDVRSVCGDVNEWLEIDKTAGICLYICVCICLYMCGCVWIIRVSVVCQTTKPQDTPSSPYTHTH